MVVFLPVFLPADVGIFHETSLRRLLAKKKKRPPSNSSFFSSGMDIRIADPDPLCPSFLSPVARSISVEEAERKEHTWSAQLKAADRRRLTPVSA